MGSISFRDPVKHSVKDLRRRALQQKVTAKSRWLNIEADGLRIDTNFGDKYCHIKGGVSVDLFLVSSE